MSSPRYDWWSYVKGMVRRYPRLKAELEELHRPAVSARYGHHGPAGSGQTIRASEEIAVRELPKVRQREYEAVRAALREVERLPEGELRLQMVRMVFWERTHTLAGVSRAVGYSERTVQRWHADFLRRVAARFGLLD